jgi:hypothetical protein
VPRLRRVDGVVAHAASILAASAGLVCREGGGSFPAALLLLQGDDASADRDPDSEQFPEG